MQAFNTFLRLNFYQRFLLVEAVMLTGLARMGVLTLSFRWIARVFGRQAGLAGQEAAAANQELQKSVRWAISATSSRVPWNANCLAQAIAATIMLRRRGHEGTVYFGVLKNEAGRCEAHAWLRSGDVIVTGAEGRSGFTVISTFQFSASLFRCHRAQTDIGER